MSSSETVSPHTQTITGQTGVLDSNFQTEPQNEDLVNVSDKKMGLDSEPATQSPESTPDPKAPSLLELICSAIYHIFVDPFIDSKAAEVQGASHERPITRPQYSEVNQSYSRGGDWSVLQAVQADPEQIAKIQQERAEELRNLEENGVGDLVNFKQSRDNKEITLTFSPEAKNTKHVGQEHYIGYQGADDYDVPFYEIGVDNDGNLQGYIRHDAIEKHFPRGLEKFTVNVEGQDGQTTTYEYDFDRRRLIDKDGNASGIDTVSNDYSHTKMEQTPEEKLIARGEQQAMDRIEKHNAAEHVSREEPDMVKSMSGLEEVKEQDLGSVDRPIQRAGNIYEQGQSVEIS